MTRHRFRYCAALTLLVGALSSICVGCSDSEAKGFCDTAAATLNDDHFSADGTGVVAELRTIDLTDIAEADRQRFLAAISETEAAIAAFRSGSSHDGWTTRSVASIATKLCGREMHNFMVMP